MPDGPLRRARLRIGALAPLSAPGWPDAGRHLVAGLELAARHVNARGGVGGRAVELLVRDSAGDPALAATVVDDLVADGVVALAGEYHSVVARAVARRAAALGVPYVCSSAVLDALTDGPTDWVARLSPPQSQGWRVYADTLAAGGHRRVVVLADPGPYWSAGTAVLADRFAAHAGRLVRLDAHEVGPHDVVGALSAAHATALLLLVGGAATAARVVAAVRDDPRHAHVLVGAPAGQPELATWAAALDGSAAGIPFLSYLPARLGALGAAVAHELRGTLGPPSFVAFEGYDTVLVLAEALETHRPGHAPGWGDVALHGTRGTIRFARSASVWQWDEAPVRVVERDPGDPGRLRAPA